MLNLHRSCRFLFALGLLILLSCAVLHAQTETATVFGRVTDQTGAVIARAEVEIKNVETNLSEVRRTNSDGLYSIPALRPGHYVISVRQAGFKTVALTGLELHVQDSVARNFVLEVGSASESITVSAEGEFLQPSPAVSTVINRQMLDAIPLNGRTVQSLITLTPGVVLTKASGGNQGQFSVNGQRADANYFTVDGVSANIGHSSFLGQIGDSGGSIPGLTATGGTNNLVSVDAMQEFRIQTSTFAPEFGRSPGGQISIVTRSGTNQWHGTLFEYLRNDKLDANDWFANNLGLGKAALRHNDFGGVLGGPIWPNHSFFFFSYEAQRLRLPNTLVSSVPSLASRQAASAAAQPYLNAFPIPNGPDLAGGLAQFSGSYSDKSTLDAVSLRIDHNLTNKINFFVRYNYAPSEFVARDTRTANRLSSSEYTTDTATAGLTALIANHITNDFRINWSRNKINTSVSNDDFGGAVPLSLPAILPPFINPGEAQFQFNIGGTLAYVDGSISKHRQKQLNVLDNVNWSHRAHQIKFGLDYRHMSPVYDPFRHSFNYFTSVPAILAGAPSFTAATFEDGPFNPIFPNWGLYAQDTWRVTPRLELTYGLRWEYNPAPHEANGKDPLTVININDPPNLALAPPGTPFYKAKKTNFAPRIGASYAVNQSGSFQTIVRGGFGIFYDLGGQDAGGGFGGYPFTAFSGMPTPFPADLSTFPQPQLKANPTAPPYDGLILGYDPDLVLPRTYQWNVAVEQQIGAPQTLSLTYVGAAGRDVLRRFSYFGSNFLPTSNLNPDFASGALTVVSNTGESNYHAMQAQFRRRLSAGLQGLVSYTWGHSLDNASDNNASIVAPIGEQNPRSDYGPADFDVRHSFASALTYNVPTAHIGPLTFLLRDWMLDGIFHAQTARPVNVILGTDNLSLGPFAANVSRPNLVSGIPLYLEGSQYPGGRIINNTPDQGGPGCLGPFCPPAPGVQGTLGRNALRAFPASQLDFGVQRAFKLTERFNLQFRAEMFNIFNHPNFGDPDNSMISGTFGQSTQMLNRNLGSATSGGGLNPLYQIGGPRSIQFALKLQF